MEVQFSEHHDFYRVRSAFSGIRSMILESLLVFYIAPWGLWASGRTEHGERVASPWTVRGIWTVANSWLLVRTVGGSQPSGSMCCTLITMTHWLN